MNQLEPKQTKILAVGSLIGALLGAGAAWLLMQTPLEPAPDEEPEPITAGDILKLTGAAAALLSMLDSFRRRL